MTDLCSSLSDTSSASLPRRGEKDFEPNPTEFQADVLSASRGAMHNALAHPRIHHPKTQVIGIYAPDGPTPPPQVKVDEKGLGVSSDYCVCVPIPKGQYFKTIGQADRWNRVWLLPEEAMYLMERGSLDIKWPRELSGIDADDVNEPLIPMSLQAAYACLLGRGGLTLERYTVFTGLRRLGYAVVRASGWDDNANAEDSKNEINKNAYTEPQQRGPGLAGIIGRCFAWLDDPFGTCSTAAGPIVGCGIHRNYSMSICSRVIVPFLTIRSRRIPQARNYTLVRPGKSRDKGPTRHRCPLPSYLPRLQALNADQKIRLADPRLPYCCGQHPRADFNPYTSADRRAAGKHASGPASRREDGSIDVYAAATRISQCCSSGR